MDDGYFIFYMVYPNHALGFRIGEAEYDVPDANGNGDIAMS